MWKISLILAWFALVGPADAADPAETRAAELARLRREVETLSADVAQRKEDLRGRLKAIEAQSLEIEVQIRREELRLAQLDGEAQARKTELATHAEQSAHLLPALKQSIAAIRGAVEAGLPYHLPERLAELDGLEEKLDAGTLSPEQATARLWSLAEDELRLARENGLDRQVIPLTSGEVLADVARLGMAALYFRTDGGLVGVAVREGDAWSWRVLDSRDDQVAVEGLFDKMKHGVRTGAFELPNPEATP